MIEHIVSPSTTAPQHDASPVRIDGVMQGRGKVFIRGTERVYRGAIELDPGWATVQDHDDDETRTFPASSVLVIAWES